VSVIHPEGPVHDLRLPLENVGLESGQPSDRIRLRDQARHQPGCTKIVRHSLIYCSDARHLYSKHWSKSNGPILGGFCHYAAFQRYQTSSVEQ